MKLNIVEPNLMLIILRILVKVRWVELGGTDSLSIYYLKPGFDSLFYWHHFHSDQTNTIDRLILLTCAFLLKNYQLSGISFQFHNPLRMRQVKVIISNSLCTRMPFPGNQIFHGKIREISHPEHSGTPSSRYRLSPAIWDWPFPVRSQSQK